MTNTEIEKLLFIDDNGSDGEVKCEVEDLSAENLFSDGRDSKRRCYCGYLFSVHSPVAQEGVVEEGTKWVYKLHSVTKETNAFGHITFVGYDGFVKKPYVRLDVDTNMSDVEDLLFKIWNVRWPDLFISVTGGAKNYSVNKGLRDTLRHGLTKIIQTTDVLIVAGGTHAGVPEHVGEAVMASGKASGKNYDIIGIAPWGCLHNKQHLINDKRMDLNTHYKIGKGRNSQISLDPIYTHFILVDDATQNMFGGEIPFKAKLMNEIVLTNRREKGIVSMPSIQLVLAGDPGTLENVHQAIENNTPTVVVKSSGLAADILTYAYLNSKEEEIEATVSAEIEHKGICQYLEDYVESAVEKMIKREFGEKETMLHLKRICYCLKNRHLLSVYKIEGKGRVNDIDVAILQALFKANKYQLIDQLKLALAWNRIDVAESFILNSDNKELTEDLYEIMDLALTQNQANFIKLCLDQGVDLKLFLTKRKLQLQYNLLPNKFLLSHVGMVVQELMEDIFHNNVSDTRTFCNALFTEDNEEEEDDPSERNEQPFKQLFIWSIVMMYQDIAKLCWAEGGDTIVTALVGYHLLKGMGRRSRDIQLNKEIQRCMNEWSCLATGVLSECHLKNENLTKDLLVMKQRNWGNKSCMSIAVQADNTDFITQTACQSVLNGIWKGRLAQANLRWRLLLCLLCPFLAPVLLDITEIETPKTGLKNKRIPFFKRVDYFFKAPVIIFLNNLCSYLVFLSLYTYILIFSFDTQISVEDIILIVWVFAFAIEEVRQVVMNSSKTLATKWHSYINDTWNKVDTITIVVFIIGIILRFLPYESTFEVARVVLALNFVMFFLRLLHIFSVHKELGPKLVMIGKMVQDLMYFLLILIVFVFSYAISSNSILYPNSPLTMNTVVQIIRKSYWNIYGELFLEEIEGEADCSNDAALWMNGTQARCPTDTGKWLVPIMMGIYMMIANVLLLNLLIAMFSNTFRKVQDNADKHWHIQRYSVINEYSTRPALFPPFNLLLPFVLLFRLIFKSGYMQEEREENRFCRSVENELELKQWEEKMAANFNNKREMKDLPSSEIKLNDTHDIIEQIHEQLEKKIPPGLESRLTRIENRLERIIQMNEKKPSDQAPGPV